MLSVLHGHSRTKQSINTLLEIPFVIEVTGHFGVSKEYYSEQKYAKIKETRIKIALERNPERNSDTSDLI